jgi:hypothetical protein
MIIPVQTSIHSVTPAKAGVRLQHINPQPVSWISASAGMTNLKIGNL